jgi:hypothetical protein
MKKFLLFSLAAFFSNAAHAQVFQAGIALANYTDIIPDQLMRYVFNPFTHQVYDLKVFGNSPDIQFTSHGSSSPGGSIAYISIRVLNPDVYIRFGRLDSTYDSTSSSWLITKVAKPLGVGEVINAPGAVWEDSMLYITDHSASFGWSKNVNDWIGGERFVGLKYSNGSVLAYAWVRLQCIDKDSCYVKDFSSTGFLTGVEEASGSSLIIYPVPVKEKLMVCFHPDAAAEICVFDIAGNCLFRKAAVGSLQEEIDLTDLPGGMYFLQVKTEQRILNRKIIKE